MRCSHVVLAGMFAALGVSLAGGGAEASEGRKPLVVVDPGHGGTNVGAAGVDGRVYEKQLNLVLARQLARELEARGVRVVLTRETDAYVSLRRRIARANELDAEAFVSIHGNATGTGRERGYETFILTPQAVDINARAIRRGEGRSRPGIDTSLWALLDDVERGAATSRAAHLASAIQDELRAVRGPEGDRGVRQASFDVLMGASMPAVLVEVGFLDHPDEGLELLDPRVRGAIAAAIAEAVAGPRGVNAAPERQAFAAGHGFELASAR
jgi:N-acetylmuramoyl-L-alanine amidase